MTDGAGIRALIVLPYPAISRHAPLRNGNYFVLFASQLPVNGNCPPQKLIRYSRGGGKDEEIYVCKDGNAAQQSTDREQGSNERLPPARILLK
ncbi:hypothetical protein CMQ_6739 [Grosmannia clavigera kw1407]|uniref:Uncharacterized protein n=1 Tax=Grosmannia clavigera (strain kw1407 / UAMH 11150) TaxID=655863 RepID=F0X6R5_GROCL|nr:uncharacterized protein CMQ_6739 [Grosmannia clavigera kw1407]EFX06418.1 hypothetical protein CMQ_6739 [Grosmannia clavigera kw1407]